MRWVAQVDVYHIREGVEGCCPAQGIIRAQCPQLVRRLLQLMAGDRKGLVVGQGVGSEIGAATASWRAETESAATWSKEDARKGFESCEKAEQWKRGQIHTKNVPISYELRADFTFLWTREPNGYLCVNLGA